MVVCFASPIHKTEWERLWQSIRTTCSRTPSSLAVAQRELALVAEIDAGSVVGLRGFMHTVGAFGCGETVRTLFFKGLSFTSTAGATDSRETGRSPSEDRRFTPTGGATDSAETGDGA